MNAKQLAIAILALPTEAQLRILKCMLLGKDSVWSSDDPVEVVVAANVCLSGPLETTLGATTLEKLEGALERLRGNA